MSPSTVFPRLVLPGLALALLGGCASQSELADLQRDQRQLARRLADTRADLESMRVAVNRLQGRLDDISGGRGARASTPDVEQRLRALEEGASSRAREPGGSLGETSAGTPVGVPEPPPSAAAAPASVSGAPPPGAPPPAAVASVPPAAPPSDDAARSADIQKDLGRGGSDQYREGLQAYQRGDYPKAVQSLRGFVTKEPKNEAVPSAQYWIGESYFAQRRYNEAILAYNEILVGWPKSDRVPAALLRQASAFAELGDKIDARLILQKLIADHPGTEEAASAKRKLLTLGS
ncbi:MAG TPA: tol-pal system protein YbgF [Candidatus Binatia bacterium]|nr:tol-pal system protein YbgF [Candidatus Binatia bacterium]